MSNQPFEFQPKSKELVIDIVHIPVHRDERRMMNSIASSTISGVQVMPIPVLEYKTFKMRCI